MKREQEAHLRKEAEKKLSLQRMLQDNEKLVEAREASKRAENELRMKIAQKYKEDLDSLFRDENESRRRKAERQRQYNELLNKQLEDRKKHRIGNEEMIESEKTLNKKKLEKALMRKEVLEQVLGSSKQYIPLALNGPI
jgi:hypothetical protein